MLKSRTNGLVVAGRRRDEQARRAILDAPVDLLLRAELPDIGIDRQTDNRWWP